MSVDLSSAKRVRVWFGRHVIATYVADPDQAERYARAMAQRFAGLRIRSTTTRRAPTRCCPFGPDGIGPHCQAYG